EHADHADDRRRVDRTAEVLVVERDVARHDRQPERLAGQRHALDRLGQLVSHLTGLGVAEVEAVGESGRTGTCASHVPGRLANDRGTSSRRDGLIRGGRYRGAPSTRLSTGMSPTTDPSWNARSMP